MLPFIFIPPGLLEGRGVGLRVGLVLSFSEVGEKLGICEKIGLSEGDWLGEFVVAAVGGVGFGVGRGVGIGVVGRGVGTGVVGTGVVDKGVGLAVHEVEA
jgi:hypothetical protein